MRRAGLPALTVLLSLLLLAPMASAQLAAYWLPDTGCSLTTQPPGGDTWEQRVRTTRLPLVVRSAGENPEWWDEIYILDTDGDLCLGEVDTYDTAVSMDTLWEHYNPPLKTLDYPLTAGKTWTASTLVTSWWGGVPRPLDLTGTVVGPRTVDTVLGPLPVIEVVIDTTDFHGTTRSVTYLLHEQLGDVTGLVAVSDCDAVPTDDINWGSLKADYR